MLAKGGIKAQYAIAIQNAPTFADIDARIGIEADCTFLDWGGLRDVGKRVYAIRQDQFIETRCCCLARHLGDSDLFTGVVSGFDGNDSFDFSDIDFAGAGNNPELF